MPIFEYQCEACGHAFEWLSQGGSTPESCPSCRASTLEKQLSVFAATSGQPETPCGNAPCQPSPCGPSCCQLN